jgi:predicted RNase H-like HicB family nuclease
MAGRGVPDSANRGNRARYERSSRWISTTEATHIRYPVTLTRYANDTVVVAFPDVPGTITFGRIEEEALARGLRALLMLFDALMKDGHDIPLPSAIEGPCVTLPPEDVARIAAYLSSRIDEDA